MTDENVLPFPKRPAEDDKALARTWGLLHLSCKLMCELLTERDRLAKRVEELENALSGHRSREPISRLASGPEYQRVPNPSVPTVNAAGATSVTPRRDGDIRGERNGHQD